MPPQSTALRKSKPPGLALRKGRYYVSVRVPESLRGVVTTGRQTHIRRSLHTTNEAEAIRRHPIALAEIKALIEGARRGPDGVRTGQDPSDIDVAADAAWWRDHLHSEGIKPADAMSDAAFSVSIEKVLGREVGAEVDESGQEHAVYEPGREERAMQLVDLVTGRKVPVGTELERFFEDKRGRAGAPLSSRYVSRIRRAVRGLGVWLAARGSDHVGSVTRYEAGLYAEQLSRTCNTGQTATSLITALSSYWRWMARRGVASENPWKDQGLESRTSPNDAEKRAYTDDEVAALLSGDTYETLHDMMRIAALSGMRINEIGRLTVADCADGVFNIRVAKTKAGIRGVPIHSALLPIVTRRCKGKAGDAYLIDELSARKDHTGDRAAKASERFTAYRRKVGIDERKEGQGQSNIDFHSFRRWFVTKAERASQPPHIISAVVGHALARQGETFKYSDGPGGVLARAVVESVVLPAGTPAEKLGGLRMGEGRWPHQSPATSTNLSSTPKKDD